MTERPTAFSGTMGLGSRGAVNAADGASEKSRCAERGCGVAGGVVAGRGGARRADAAGDGAVPAALARGRADGVAGGAALSLSAAA